MTKLALLCVVQNMDLFSSACLTEDLDSGAVEHCATEPEDKLEPAEEVNSVVHDSAVSAVEVYKEHFNYLNYIPFFTFCKCANCS